MTERVRKMTVVLYFPDERFYGYGKEGGGDVDHWFTEKVHVRAKNYDLAVQRMESRYPGKIIHVVGVFEGHLKEVLP